MEFFTQCQSSGFTWIHIMPGLFFLSENNFCSKPWYPVWTILCLNLNTRIVKYFKLVFEVEPWKFNKFQVTEFSEATVSFVTLPTGYLMWPTLCSWSTVLEASWTREQLVVTRHWWETTYHISSPSASPNFKNNLVNEWSFSPWSGEPISDWTKV